MWLLSDLTHYRLLRPPSQMSRSGIGFFFERSIKCYIFRDTDRTVQAPRVTGYFAPQVYLPGHQQCFMQPVVVVFACILQLRESVYSFAPFIQMLNFSRMPCGAFSNRAILLFVVNLQLLADLDPLLGGEGLGTAARFLLAKQLLSSHTFIRNWSMLTAQWGRQRRGQ